MGLEDDLNEASVALRAAGRALFEGGLAPGSSGNMSLFCAGSIVVTPGGSMLGALRGLSVVGLDGKLLRGPVPTKEVPMHLAVYCPGSPWAAAIHLHSPYATLMSALREIDESDAILPLTPYLTMKAGKVRVLPYEKPGSSALGRHVAEFIAAGGKACLLRNHGCLVVDTSLESALALAFELEEAAKMVILGRGMALSPLTPEQRNELF